MVIFNFYFINVRMRVTFFLCLSPSCMLPRKSLTCLVILQAPSILLRFFICPFSSFPLSFFSHASVPILSPSSSSFDSSSTPYGLSVLFHPVFIHSTSPFHLSPFSCASPFSFSLSNCILFFSGPPLPACSSVERWMFFSGSKVMERSWSAFRFGKWKLKGSHTLWRVREKEREIVSRIENARALNKMYAGQFKHNLVWLQY